MNKAAHSRTRNEPLSVGDQFLKFEIRALLGQGGHGFVYHGYDSFLDRHVAIKLIPNPADRGKDLARRAQLEARVLCKLHHPNVVRVIDAGATAQGAVYIVMEILHGRTLRDVMRDLGGLRATEVLSVGAQIADGVQAAHDQSAIHRDLKPENVFVLEDNAVKVLDFGIAKFLGPGAATTQRDLLHGTLIYMSPEHLQGMRVTVRSDIYALGTTLYEAFAGRPPCLLGMDEPTLESLTFAQMNRMPPPLNELMPSVPRFVARSIQRMIAKNPVDRFASMAEVADVLRSNLRRVLDESIGASTGNRDLWQGRSPTLPPASATQLSCETTDADELGRTSSPSIAARARPFALDVPVSKPLFFEERAVDLPSADLMQTTKFRRLAVSSPTPPQLSRARAVPMTPRAEAPARFDEAARRPPLTDERAEAAKPFDVPRPGARDPVARRAAIPETAAPVSIQDALAPDAFRRWLFGAVCVGATAGVVIGLIEGPRDWRSHRYASVLPSTPRVQPSIEPALSAGLHPSDTTPATSGSASMPVPAEPVAQDILRPVNAPRAALVAHTFALPPSKPAPLKTAQHRQKAIYGSDEAE